MRLPYYTAAGEAEHLDALAWIVSWHIHWAQRGLADPTLCGRVRSDLDAARVIVTGLMVVSGQLSVTRQQAAALAYLLHELLIWRWQVAIHSTPTVAGRTALQLDALNWLSERIHTPRVHGYVPHYGWADIRPLLRGAA